MSLKLKEADQNIFLETRFEYKDGVLQHRLKNDNELGARLNTWRYQHFKSYGGYITKRATLFAALTKIQKAASDDRQLTISAIAKLEEFKHLQYPLGIRRFACAIMARDYSSIAWRRIRSLQA